MRDEGDPISCKNACNEVHNRKRGCEEMRIHFFTAPFYFAFIWFRVQGSGGGFAAFFLEDGILVSQPSPLGEGARKGRIG